MNTENIWIQIFAKLSYDKEEYEKKRTTEEIYNLQ